MRFYSEVGSQYPSRKIFIQALITPNSNCFLNGETISCRSDMISTYENYISSGCKVSHNVLPNFIFPHIFCAHLDYGKQQVQFERASFLLKPSSCLPARSIPAANALCMFFCPWFSGSLCLNICFMIVVNPNCFSLGGYQNKRCYEISLPS